MPRSLFLIFDEMIDLFPLCKCKAFLSPKLLHLAKFIRHGVDGNVRGKLQNENNVFKFIKSRVNGLQINSAIEEFDLF